MHARVHAWVCVRRRGRRQAHAPQAGPDPAPPSGYRSGLLTLNPTDAQHHSWWERGSGNHVPANLVPLHQLHAPEAGIDIPGPQRFPQPTGGPIDFYLGK